MQNDEQLFSGIAAECCQVPSSGDCQCSPKERIVRQYARGAGPRQLTADERDNFASDADYCGEGYYKRADLDAMTDADLAHAVLNAWNMYVQSNC